MFINGKPKTVIFDELNLQNIRVNRINALNQNTNQEYEEIDYNSSMIDMITEIKEKLEDRSKPYNSIDYSKIKEDGYISQSLVRINGKTFITAYTTEKKLYEAEYSEVQPTSDETETIEQNLNINSRIYVYDENGNYEGILELNNSAHVGGISYDKDNDILYVTNTKGKIDAYDYDKIINNINNKANDYFITLGDDYSIDCDIKVNNLIKDYWNMILKNHNISNIKILNLIKEPPASTIYYDRGKLYIGKYVADGKGNLITLKPTITIDDNGNKSISYDKEEIKIQDNLPKQIQGIATTNYNGKEYLVISCSAGFVTNSLAPSSRLRLYEYDENTNEYKGLGFIYIDRLSEGIDIDEYGNISVIFEKEIMQTYETNIEYLINNVSYDDNIVTETVATLGGLGG